MEPGVNTSDNHKWCPKCETHKLHKEFNKNKARSDGLNSICRGCQRVKYREFSERYKAQARERAKKRTSAFRRGWRAKAIQVYGGECTCCGETNLAFLCIDHIRGGASQNRQQNLYYEMKEAALNPDHDTYQVLCANCNMAKERAEGCPHQDPNSPDYNPKSTNYRGRKRDQ